MSKKLQVALIAEQTGLSLSTVSRVLAGKANTSEKTRRRGRGGAKALGGLGGMAAGGRLREKVGGVAPRRAVVGGGRNLFLP
ncbi:hypothetical protein B8W50_15005, partial [Cronobacter sakazakii]|uniref:LacI family DNA-binding transcriptional regulator n=1 Tax=Cronobacter sakazakii TaxID=28141 RepID=UPI000D50E40B